MIIFATATIKSSYQESESVRIVDELSDSERWIQEMIINSYKYDKTILINNKFLIQNNIDLNYYKRIFPPNIKYYNKSWWSVGWQVWKSLSIRKILSELKEGDILYYHDSNISKYPYYKKNFLLGKQKINKLIKRNRNKSIFFFHECYKPLMFDIKYEALAERKINFPYSYKTGVWSGSLIIKKDIDSCKFIDNWCDMSKTILSSQNEYPFISKIFYPRFVQHSVDQSTLNLCIEDNNKNIKHKVKYLKTYKRIISFNIFNQFVYQLRDLYKFFIWIGKDIFYYVGYLINGKNKFYDF